jgi:aerobic-type carbon monoxide dehydrogenase small subunit (CoxS/CutS family)
MDLNFVVNQKNYLLTVDPSDSLLSILREKLQLMGTKNGCSQGHCGACTVVMDGKAVKSCLIKAKRLDHTEIITIEGITDDYELHPIQEAFIEKGAVQCGFCTMGYIMELYSLFNVNPVATEEEIRGALEGHLCRCTGYKPILEAALLSQEKLRKRK